MSVKLYLVGDQNSPKTNSWLAMTNCEAEALNLLNTLEGASCTKCIDVPPARRRNGKATRTQNKGR